MNSYARADFPRLEAPMTPKRYLECLRLLGQSQRGLAPILRCSDKLPRQWAIGGRTIPPLVAGWLEDCVKNRTEHPDPVAPTPKQWRSVTGGAAPRPYVERGARMARTGPAPNLFKEFHKSAAPKKKLTAAQKAGLGRSMKAAKRRAVH